MQNEIIEVILTGGRIEKVINEEIGRLNYTDTSFKAWVEQAHCPLNFSKHLLMLKDSQDITGADLEAITACCTHTPGKRVIIAHGVNTMIRTALHLKQFAELAAKAEHPELMLTEKQMAKLQSVAGSLRKITGKTVAAVVEERCDCYREDAEGNIEFTWKDSCGAARSFFAVGPSGMLRPCLHIPYNICHWKDFRNFKQCRPV